MLIHGCFFPTNMGDLFFIACFGNETEFDHIFNNAFPYLSSSNFISLLQSIVQKVNLNLSSIYFESTCCNACFIQHRFQGSHNLSAPLTLLFHILDIEMRCDKFSICMKPSTLIHVFQHTRIKTKTRMSSHTYMCRHILDT